MFFFSKNKPKYENFSAVEVDMHSHLIPGVDDGSPDLRTSISLVSGLKSLGFKTLFSTPHTMEVIHPNTAEDLNTSYKNLTPHIPNGIDLFLSSEYFMDELFQEQVKSESLLLLPGNRILLEFSQISKPQNLEEVIFDLEIKGYQVVLAHPERYLFFHNQFSYYTRLKDMGVEFQVNALSLTRHYGPHIQKIAEKLIDEKMIDFIGTDLHHEGHLETLKRVPEKKHFAKLVDSGLLKNKTLVV